MPSTAPTFQISELSSFSPGRPVCRRDCYLNPEPDRVLGKLLGHATRPLAAGFASDDVMAVVRITGRGPIERKAGEADTPSDQDPVGGGPQVLRDDS
jgi:hypothetical protein